MARWFGHIEEASRAGRPPVARRTVLRFVLSWTVGVVGAGCGQGEPAAPIEDVADVVSRDEALEDSEGADALGDVGLAGASGVAGRASWLAHPGVVRAPVTSQAEAEAAEREGRASLVAGRYEEAVAAYLSAANLRPEARAWAAFARLSSGRLGSARRWAARAVAEAPESRTAHRIAALVAEADGRDAEAEQEWRRVLELSPGDAGAWLGLAGLACRAERLVAARGFVEQALTVARTSEARAAGLAGLAELEALSGALSVAERNARAALALDPGSAGAHAALAMVLDVTGRPSEAIVEASRAEGLSNPAILPVFVWPELREQAEALAAEGVGNRRAAIASWLVVAQRESSVGLRWKALEGRAAAGLARLDAAQGARRLGPGG